MPMIYNSQKVIPAPFVSINKKYNTNGDGKKVGSTFSLQLVGTIVAYMGSPNSSGVFWNLAGYPPDESIGADSRLAAILRKQEALRTLFAEPGHWLEIDPFDGSPPVRCLPDVIEINFAEDIWFNVCRFTINVETDTLYIAGTPQTEDNFTHNLISAEEEWSLQFGPIPNVYELSHNVSAQARQKFEDDGSGDLELAGWQRAKNWVMTRLGYSSNVATASGVFNLSPSFTGYNHSRQMTQNESAGSFSVNENWIVNTEPAYEEFTVDVRNDAASNMSTVAIQGTINGLEERDGNFQISVDKYTNAADKWATVQSLLITRAQTYSGLTVNALPQTQTVTHSPVVGVITYNYEYTNRPCSLVQSVPVRNESLTVTDNNPKDIFAMIPVLGRADGPVFQDMNTVSEHVRQVTYEGTLAPASGCTPAVLVGSYNSLPRNEIKTLVEGLRPTGFNFVFTSADDESYDFFTGRYTRTMAWTYGD